MANDMPDVTITIDGIDREVEVEANEWNPPELYYGIGWHFDGYKVSHWEKSREFLPDEYRKISNEDDARIEEAIMEYGPPCDESDFSDERI